MIAADLLSYVQTTTAIMKEARPAAIRCPQAVDNDVPGERRRAAPASTNFTGAVSAVHINAPAFPQVAHSAVHRDVLTHRGIRPSFAWQESPGSGSRVFWGRGANGPQRSERPPAMSLRRPGTPGHAPNSLN